MKYGILFVILAVILCFQAVVHGGWYWMLVWPGLSFATVGAAYLGLGPGVFGKRPDGTMARCSTVFLLPYLVLAWLTWHVVRLTSKEDCCNEVVPGLFVGRRPLVAEVPEAVTLIVDLTSEFAVEKAVRKGRRYVAVPMLDGGTPSKVDFEDLVRQIAEWPGPVYVHCAQGHGRSAMVAAAVLIAKGHAGNVEEAVTALRKARPRVTLNGQQLAFLKRICSCETSLLAASAPHAE